MYRLIALDLDDTLLGHDESISPEHRMAVQTAKDRGYGVTLVTARSWRGTSHYVRDLGLALPVICMTGAAVYSSQGEPLRMTPVTLEDTRRLAALADRERWTIRLYYADGSVIHSRPAEDYLAKSGAFYPTDAYVGDISPCLENGEAPIQVVLLGHRSVEGVMDRLPELPGVVATPYERGSQTSRLHLMHASVSKGAALESYCRERSIPRDSVIAMGDGLADLTMIQWAGVGVAMGWAPEEVRRSADLVVPADEPHPVATALRELLG